MINIPGRKGNANQNHIETLPHSYLNVYHQTTQATTNVGEHVRKKESLCTVGGNVN
jgi:hypothetical protein